MKCLRGTTPRRSHCNREMQADDTPPPLGNVPLPRVSAYRLADLQDHSLDLAQDEERGSANHTKVEGRIGALFHAAGSGFYDSLWSGGPVGR